MKRLLLPAALLCLVLISNTVSPAGRLLAQSETTGVKEILLKDALKLIGDAHGIRFAYERSLIAGIKVSYNWDAVKTADPEQVLKTILTQGGLSFVTIAKNYFTIVKKQQPGAGAPPAGQVQLSEVLAPAAAVQSESQAKDATITGRITNATTGKPIGEVTITISQLGMYTISDDKGFFRLDRLPAGRFTLVVQGVNTVAVEKEINITEGNNAPLNFAVQENILSLKEVQVVGIETKSLSRSTLIGRAAIEHMQATNLGEVLQLLPGAIASNPDFSGVNKIALRQYGDVSAANVASLGTAVIVNGAPISNNANLQAMNTATAGVLASFSTASGAGVDMRQLSADNVESVEVIRGIPSVEYGDLTAGAVIVKTKARKEPAQLKARLNPKLTQFWLGKGFDLGENKGALFADIDYTKAYDKQTRAYDAFDRVTSSLQYTNSFGKYRPLHTNTQFSFAMNLDESKVDPDYALDQVVRKAQDYAFRFSTNGKWNLGKRFARSLNYTLSASYSHQKGFQQQYYTSDISPVSTAKENTTIEVDYLASRYLNQLWIDGKPLNLFAKLSDNFYLKSGSLTHSFLVGADWRLDANYGAGKTFDEKLPPRTTDNAGFRARSYKDIPAMNQVGVYAEDKITTRFGERDFALQLGLRYDKVQPFKSNAKAVLAPRVNASYELLNKFYLRAGWGITAKAPTLLYLYPENAYFDIVSLNYYKENAAERLALMTTRVFNSENPDLKMTKTNKNEIGFDWSFGRKRRLSVTAYYEETKNGYEMSSSSLNSFQYTNVPQYKVASAPAGQKPVLSPDVTDSLFVVSYAAPTNSRHIINKGVEFDLDMGRFDEIRTSFVFSGAYISTRSTNSDPYILAQRVANQPMTRLGVFGSDRGKSSERFATTLRAIHNIPELRFIVTLAAQTIWVDKDRYVNYSSIPTGYVPVTSAGDQLKIVEFTKAERDAITAADRDIYLSIADSYYRTESWKPLWLFNLKLTKEFAKNMVFSFYANNVLNYRPLQASKRNPTDYTKRNIDLFFGTELSIKF